MPRVHRTGLMAAAPGRVRLGTSDRYWDCRRARHQIMSAQNAHIWTVPVPHRDPRGPGPARILAAPVVRYRRRDARSRRGGPGPAHGRPVPAARRTAPRRYPRTGRSARHHDRPPARLTYADARNAAEACAWSAIRSGALQRSSFAFRFLARLVQEDLQAFQTSSQGHCGAHSSVTYGYRVVAPGSGRVSCRSSISQPQPRSSRIMSPWPR